MKSLALTLAALLTTLILSPAAQAAVLTDSNDLSLTSYQSADGMNITTDSATSLDWLDVTTTTGLSHAAVSALLGVGELSDFRYASLAEVDLFFNHLGLPTGPFPSGGSVLDPGGALFASAIGHTGQSNLFAQQTIGITGTPHPSSGFYTGYISFNSSFSGVTSTAAGSGSTGNLAVGSWLIRDSIDEVVPEPSSVVIWGLLGVAGLASSRRSVRRHNYRSA